MTEQQESMEQIQDSIRLNVGAIVREARERMGMSVEDVAGRLKFAPKQITALEEGDFDRLPEMTFVRGFVRSYAKLVQVDEAPLLAALPSAPAPQPLPEGRAREQLVPGFSEGAQQNLLWLIGALIVAVVIGFLAWEYEGGQAPKRPPSTPAPASEVTAGEEAKPAEEAKPGVEPKLGEALKPAELPKPAEAIKPPEPVKPAEIAKPRPEMKPRVEVKPRTPAKPPVAIIPGEATSAGERIPGAGVGIPQASPPAASAPAGAATGEQAPEQRASRLLRLEFDEDSWVEVKDGTGKLLLSMMGRQGTGQTVSGPPPISVTIGNAKGVRVYYKGEPVDVARRTYQNVAHLTLE